MNAFPDWLHHHAGTSPGRTALVGRRAWSYAELDRAATQIALRLRTLGAGPDAPVATLLHNGDAAAAMVHAAGRAHATLVPLNVRLAAPELAWQLAHSGARVLVAHAPTAPLAAAVRALHPDVTVASTDAEGARLLGAPDVHGVAPHDAPPRLVHPADATHTIVYTSGTTGRPKGARLTWANHWWSAVGSALLLGARTDDRWLAVLPLFHVGGQAIVLRAAIGGMTAVVHDGFDERRVNAAIDDDGITILSAVPAMLQRMLDARDDRAYPSTLRAVLLGGGPVPAPLLARCARLGVPVAQTYGMTETASQVATLPPEEAVRRAGSAGRANWPNAIRVARADGADASPGEPGEILVRGPVVTAGYLGDDAATGAAIVDGWLHSGDVGTLDADGWLTVLDRRDDLIVTGGENVYPAEVEAALLAHPTVLEAAAIGVPDAHWGRRVAAVVRLRDAAVADADEIRAHCRALLGAYKTPSEIRIVAEPLPRTASGKLRRAAVRDAWQ